GATAILIASAGGPGNDTLAGGAGDDRLLGGDGNDVIDGNKGSDIALMGTGDDVFVWDPGDGSDQIEGEAGSDTMRFNGAAAAEQFTLSANGNRFKLFRDVGNVTMDTAGVETVDVNALGGADLVTVGDLSGTEVTSVNVDLASTLGGTAGDAALDHVVVTGTPGNDTLAVSGDSNAGKVARLPPTAAILHPEPSDRLDIDSLGGIDVVGTGGLAAGAMQAFFDGIPIP